MPSDEKIEKGLARVPVYQQGLKNEAKYKEIQKEAEKKEEPRHEIQKTPTYTDGDKNCSDFSSQRAAQRFFESQGPNDPHGLDRVDDGIACESLR